MALARALAVEPRVLLLDEPFGALDAKVRAELREWLRRLHDEVHVTTVLVTHDQEEAMAISDHIAVMDEGRIEQVGAPRELYDKPANRFVMGFLGPVSKVGDELVRPHDIAISTRARRRRARGRRSTRIVHLGFEVRVELAPRRRRARVGAGDAATRPTQLELAEGARRLGPHGRASPAREPPVPRQPEAEVGRPGRRPRPRARRAAVAAPSCAAIHAADLARAGAQARVAERAPDREPERARAAAAGAAGARRRRPSRRARRSPPCRRPRGRRRPRSRRTSARTSVPWPPWVTTTSQAGIDRA